MDLTPFPWFQKTNFSAPKNLVVYNKSDTQATAGVCVLHSQPPFGGIIAQQPHTPSRAAGRNLLLRVRLHGCFKSLASHKRQWHSSTLVYKHCIERNKRQQYQVTPRKTPPQKASTCRVCPAPPLTADSAAAAAAAGLAGATSSRSSTCAAAAASFLRRTSIALASPRRRTNASMSYSAPSICARGGGVNQGQATAVVESEKRVGLSTVSALPHYSGGQGKVSSLEEFAITGTGGARLEKYLYRLGGPSMPVR